MSATSPLQRIFNPQQNFTNKKNEYNPMKVDSNTHK